MPVAWRAAGCGRNLSPDGDLGLGSALSPLASDKSFRYFVQRAWVALGWVRVYVPIQGELVWVGPRTKASKLLGPGAPPPCEDGNRITDLVFSIAKGTDF